MKKILALILALVLAVPASVFAFAAPEETVILEPVFKVNPLYEGIISVEKPERKIENGINAYGVTYHTDIADVGAEARGNLKNRTEIFSVGYKTKNFSSNQFGQLCDDILSYAFMHTGVSDEGDYIQWHWGHYDAGGSYSYNGEYYNIDIVFYFTYYTTAEQEAAVAEKLEEVYEELNLEEKNDYYKICAIYDYICDNIVYDYDNLNNEAYRLQYTAYGALINGTSVCQGYANLFYRMALDWGIDTRLIAGDSGGPHAWNIVKMGHYYYNLDSTWDAGLRPNYMWFLKCPSTFVNHYRDHEYSTPEFNAAYPMGATDYVYDESDFGGPGDDFGGSNIVAYGYCGGEGDGKNLEWSLDKDGVLTISGEGKMADYDYGYSSNHGKNITNAPWGYYTDSVKTIEIEEGITYIGQSAFYRLSNAAGTLAIPESVTEIGDNAFAYCWGFGGELVLPEILERIGEEAFYYCYGFTGDIVIPDKVEYIGELAFAYSKGFDGNIILGSNISEIDSYAFYMCQNLEGCVAVPESLKKIGNYTFSDCGINEYKFICDAPSVGSSAFDVSYDTIYYPKGNDTWKIVDGKWNGYNAVSYSSDIASGYCGGEGDGKNLEWSLDKDGVLTISGEGAMEDYGIYCDGVTSKAPWIEHKDSIEKLVISEGVTSIGRMAFDGCSDITGELNLPESLTIIEEYAFYKCSGFTGKLVIPNNVTQIGSYAFYSCSGFTGDLIIPNSVTEISDFAFRECGGFSGKLVISEKLTEINQGVFQNCWGLKGDIVIPEGIEEIGGWAFYNCGFDGNLILPEGIKSIEKWAFASCDKLEGNLILPESVVSLGDSVFQYCYGLSGKFVGGENLKNLGEQTFFDCGIDDYYFKGDAPEAFSKGSYQTFDSDDVIYYPEGNATWKIVDGKWKGYNAVAYSYEPDAVLSISEIFAVDWKESVVSVTVSEESFANAIQFAVKYNPEVLEFVSCSAGELTKDATINPEDGIIYFGWESTKSLEEGGELLNIVFKAAEGAEAGEYAVEIDTSKKFIFSGKDFGNLDMEIVNGKVEILDGTCGDLTGDSEIDIKDAYFARLVAAKLIEPTAEQIFIGDVDGDGKITAIDANIMRKFAVNIIKKLPVE